MVALLGANGAGKPTTLKAISGLLRTENGEVTRGEIVVRRRARRRHRAGRIVRRGISQVLEGRRIVADMTCSKISASAPSRAATGCGSAHHMVLRVFPRLQERSGLAGYLSGGEQQMLAIGRGLMARPKLILMDEPSMGLSPLLVKEVFAGSAVASKRLAHHSAGRAERARGARRWRPTATSWSRERSCSTARGQPRKNEDVKEFYLGGPGEQRKSFKNLKSYWRRKRWLASAGSAPAPDAFLARMRGPAAATKHEAQPGAAAPDDATKLVMTTSDHVL